MLQSPSQRFCSQRAWQAALSPPPLLIEPQVEAWLTGSAFLLGEDLLRLQHDGTSPSRLGVRCVGLLWCALRHALGGTENQPVEEETEVARPRGETEAPWTQRTTQPMREEPLWFWWVCILGSALSVRLSFCLSKGFGGCMMLVINTHILKSRHYLFYLLC